MFKSVAFRTLLGVITAGFLIWVGGTLAINRRQDSREQMRARALPITVQNAQPLIFAIERYHQERGAPPSSLSLLVPRYLPQIPDAGPAAEGGWRYENENRWAAGGWSLLIRVRDEYSPNFLGFGDTFVFHPNSQYPGNAYGGGLKPIGKWGYYVE